MTNVLNISTQISNPLQILGLLIIAIALIVLAIILYKTIRFIGFCVLKFYKVDVEVDKGGLKANVHLRQ